ncbi:MAG: hypothetical protein LBR92_03815 [Puniceicoccales bacterium]|nr:hypothetical protein [Puniceicoccales bacterium]
MNVEKLRDLSGGQRDHQKEKPKNEKENGFTIRIPEMFAILRNEVNAKEDASKALGEDNIVLPHLGLALFFN